MKSTGKDKKGKLAGHFTSFFRSIMPRWRHVRYIATEPSNSRRRGSAGELPGCENSTSTSTSVGHWLGKASLSVAVEHLN